MERALKKKKSFVKSCVEGKAEIEEYEAWKAHDANASYEVNMLCLWKLEKLPVVDESGE